jgi:hypothetical protein
LLSGIADAPLIAEWAKINKYFEVTRSLAAGAGRRAELKRGTSAAAAAGGGGGAAAPASSGHKKIDCISN